MKTFAKAKSGLGCVGMKAGKPACIIFDLDGTLVDSESLGARALCEMIPAMDIEVEVFLGRYRGWKLANVLSDIESRYDLQLGAEFVPSYRAHADMLFQKSLETFPGVHEALAQLDLPMCVASNGPRAKIESILKKTGLAGFFGQNLFSSYEIGSWKPDPGLFLFAADAMKIDPENCLVIEDSDVGVVAAKAARIPFLRYTGGHPAAVQDAASFQSFEELPQKVVELCG